MRKVILASAKAVLSALLDAVEAGEEVKITRRGRPVARVIRERADPRATDWVARLSCFHTGIPGLEGSAVYLVRGLRSNREP